MEIPTQSDPYNRSASLLAVLSRYEGLERSELSWRAGKPSRTAEMHTVNGERSGQDSLFAVLPATALENTVLPASEETIDETPDN